MRELKELKALREIHEIQEKIYEERMHLGIEEEVKAINENAERYLKKAGFKLKIISRADRLRKKTKSEKP